MLFALLCTGALTSQQILDACHQKMAAATTISMTTRYFFEEVHKHETISRYLWKKGGFLRSERGQTVELGNPSRGWRIDSEKKSFAPIAAVPSSFTLEGIWNPQQHPKSMPTIGAPTRVIWHSHHVLRIKLDGTKVMTRETKLFLFFDPKTYLPAGVSANLGSATQILVIEDLKLNLPIDDKAFDFEPPKGWTEVKDPGAETT